MVFGGRRIGIEHLPNYIRQTAQITQFKSSFYTGKTLKEMVAECEKSAIYEAYMRAGRKVIDASKMLGISRKTFWEKVKKYRIDLR